MTYSQKPLVSLFVEGKVPGESGRPEHIETVISNVFLFPERVYKIYKNDNAFFNEHFRDITGRATRMAFTEGDFKWNHQLSPSVYIGLQAVRAGRDAVEYIDDHEFAEEFVCITKRLPSSASFFSILRNGGLGDKDFFSIGKQFAEREALAVFPEVPGETFAENVMSRFHDNENWVSDGVMDAWVPRAEIKQWLRYLKGHLEVLAKDTSQTLAFCFDIHSLNAFYYEKEFIPFDTSPPKESWRFGPPAINVYRLASDVFVYAGERAYRSFLDGYSSASGRPPLKSDEEKMWVIYASLIMMQHLFFLGQTDTDKLPAAQAYLAFLRKFHPVSN